MGEFCPSMTDAPGPRRFRLRAAARADRPASGGRAQRLAPARRAAPMSRSTAHFRDLPDAAARRRPARRQRHRRDQGAPVRRQGERRRGRGAGRAGRGRRRRPRPAAREQVAEGRQRSSASPTPSTPRCSAAPATTARCSRCAFPTTRSPLLERHGHVPLPPYIERADDGDDVARYQTVFAERPGRGRRADGGAPLRRGAARRARRARRRAHGGDAARRRRHLPAGAQRAHRRATSMHSERYEVGAGGGGGDRRGRASAAAGSSRSARPACARSNRRRCAATGEALRAGARRDRSLHHARLPVSRRRPAAHQLPPAEEHAADAGRRRFAGHARIRALYAHAIAERYRFFSYGDAMLLARSDERPR